MSASALTVIIVCAVVAVLIGWDIYVAFFNTEPNERDTISGILRTAGSRVAFIPFAWGGLGGHFWGPDIEPALGGWSIPVLLAVSLAASLSHLGIEQLLAPTQATQFVKVKPPRRLPVWTGLVYLVIGIPCGALLWPQ